MSYAEAETKKLIILVINKAVTKQITNVDTDSIFDITYNKDGEVILKKYSPIGELSEFAVQYAETLAKTSGHVACITDKDSVIAVSGAPKREFLDKNISYELEKIMNDKSTIVAKSANEKKVPIFSNENLDKYYAQVISPIVSEGDTIGSVVLMSTDTNAQMGEAEIKLAQSAAGFLGKQMEQ
jgi:AbrB family transcriptional regulator (stage V sporulation protein T)